MPGEPRELYLVDGSGYVFRAFFALPQLNNSRGIPTNAVFGFTRMILKLLKDVHPRHIAVVFDAPGKTFRDELFADYKANRPEAPADLRAQIPYIHRAVEALRLPIIAHPGVEADDVLGTLARRAARKGFKTTIITADKDLMQLVGPRVTLWDTMRDRRTGVAEIRRRFGVDPPMLVEIMALTGDAIDNIKGVPGIGEKTASALVQKFGTLEHILSNLESVAQSDLRAAKKVARLLAEHREDAELAKKLVTIDCHVSIETEPEELEWPGIDRARTADLMRELEFSSIAAELEASDPAPATDGARVQLVASEHLPSILEGLAREPRIALHLDTDLIGADRLALASGRGTFVIPHQHIRAAKPLLESAASKKTCHDLKSHIRRLSTFGIELQGVDFDTMLAGFLLDPGRPEPKLGELCRVHLAPLGGRGADEPDPKILHPLREALLRRLEEAGLSRLLEEIEIPTAKVLAAMEAEGIGVDAAALRRLSEQFASEAQSLEAECHGLVGRRFNLNSPIQLREVLFGDLKLPTRGVKKTKGGFSTDADTLENLSTESSVPGKILHYRTVAKLKSTYADALEALIDPRTGRIHTTFHQALTATGRLSSSDPNLQNIPVRSPEGMKIRRAFVPRPGWLFLSADYSQIELRVLAHLSGDQTLVEAFSRGEDVHTRTATEVLGIRPEQVDAEARRLAKVINFGIIYGMGPQRLGRQLGISLKEASEYIERYFDRLPGVRAWLDLTVALGRKRGYVSTMYGRRRYLPDLDAGPSGARAQAERIAVNTPLQGSAADLIKVAMIRICEEIKERRLAARMVLQVHDELLLEVSREALIQVREVARRQMEGAAVMKVPLKVELKQGPNWAEMTGAV